MSQTQQFDGESIEAALAAAADTLGPNVQVAEARKVRKGGVLGFFAQERYEVEAFATEGTFTPVAPKPRTVEQAFDTLLAEVEAAEAPTPEPVRAAIPPLKQEPHWVDSLSSFLSEDETPADISAPLVGRHFAKPGTQPTAVAQHTAATTLIAEGEEARVRRARLAGGEPDWSCMALYELGVPRVICEYIAKVEPTTDRDWMNALEAAIEELTPPTARSTDLICTLGQGQQAAVAMLRAGVAGVAPGILYVDGREIVATPTELALAVRACLPR